MGIPRDSYSKPPSVSSQNLLPSLRQGEQDRTPPPPFSKERQVTENAASENNVLTRNNNQYWQGSQRSPDSR